MNLAVLAYKLKRVIKKSESCTILERGADASEGAEGAQRREQHTHRIIFEVG